MVKLRIEGYPSIISEKEIEKIFNKYGSVEKVDKDLGRNVARVIMTYDYQAVKALKGLDGSKVFGRVVKVSEEKEQEATKETLGE